MAKKYTRLFSAVLTVCLILSACSLFASAAYIQPDDTQSSAYLDSYSADTDVDSTGRVYVSVSVDACVYATQVGAKTIYIYESTNGTNFSCVATYNSAYYPEMLGSGWSYDDTPIEYQGVAGRYYFSRVQVYAADAYGSDSRWYNTVTVQ